MDANGNFYIADSGNARIRKVSVNGTIATVAGGGSNGDGGPAPLAQLRQPQAVAADGSGNIYVSDSQAHRVRKMSADGTITTVAGTGASGYSGDGGAATAAELNLPNGVVVDASGNLYIADTNNCRVRKVSSTGTITTFAGTGSCGYAGDGGQAANARLSSPEGLALDQSGNLYIADEQNQRIRMVSTAGIITTVAGSGHSGFSGDCGPAVSAQLNFPYAVAVDGTGSLYIELVPF